MISVYATYKYQHMLRKETKTVNMNSLKAYTVERVREEKGPLTRRVDPPPHPPAGSSGGRGRH
jgi:hypothetical protein